MAARLRVSGPPVGKYARDVLDFEKPLARAVTGAFRDGARLIESQMRAAILGAKLGPRFARQFRAFAFPRRQFSLNPAIRGWHARGWRQSMIGRYANIFAHGGQIAPKSARFLWIPLPTAPRLTGGRRITPAIYTKEIGPLHFIRVPGHAPMLAGDALQAVSGRRATVSQLKTGALNAAVRGGRASLISGRKGRRTVRVPIFVGVSGVRIDKRVDADGIFARVNAQLPELFAQRMSKAA